MLNRIIRKFLMNLLELFREKPNNERLNHIHTDKNGNNFYSYDVPDLPNDRRVLMKSILYQMSLGIEESDLQDLLLQMKKTIHLTSVSNISENKDELLGTISNISTRVSSLTQLKLLKRAALVCIVLPDEPIEYSKKWEKKKLKMIDNDEDLAFFFMHFSMTTIQGYQNMSISSFKNWVMKEEMQMI